LSGVLPGLYVTEHYEWDEDNPDGTNNQNLLYVVFTGLKQRKKKTTMKLITTTTSKPAALCRLFHLNCIKLSLSNDVIQSLS
jgi:hypothetical protein